MQHHAVQITDLSLNSEYEIDELILESGQYLGVVGPVNSGKSHLLLAMAGIGVKRDAIDRHSTVDDFLIGYLPTNPNLIFSGMKSTLEGELDLSSQLIGRPPTDVSDVIERLHLKDLLERDPFTLSGGEMVRAAIAIVASKRPTIWLIDQIYDWLHPNAVSDLRRFFRSEIEQGCSVMETHSRCPDWHEDFDHMIVLDTNGKVLSGTYETLSQAVSNSFLLSETDQISVQLFGKLGQIAHENGSLTATAATLLKSKRHRTEANSPPAATENTIIIASEMSHSYSRGGFSLGPIDLSINTGEAVAVIGPNGSGKSTFLQCIANLLTPTGRLSINGRSPEARKWEWAKEAIYCFQNPDDQLYLPTTIDEIKTTLKALNREVPADLDEHLDRLGLLSCADKEPFHLPRPLRRQVGLAIGLLSGSPVILLDEPTAGIDSSQRQSLIKEIRQMRSAGTVFLIVSHDFSFITQVASRLVQFCDGKIVEDSPLDTWSLETRPILVKIAKMAEIPISEIATRINDDTSR